jgi:hypothetical protein
MLRNIVRQVGDHGRRERHFLIQPLLKRQSDAIDVALGGEILPMLEPIATEHLGQRVFGLPAGGLAEERVGPDFNVFAFGFLFSVIAKAVPKSMTLDEEVRVPAQPPFAPGDKAPLASHPRLCRSM